MIRFVPIAIVAAAHFAALPDATASVAIVNAFMNGHFEDGELYPSYEDRTPQTNVGSWIATSAPFLGGPFEPGEFSALAPGDTELRQDFYSFTSDNFSIAGDISASGAAAFGMDVVHISFWAAHPQPPASNILVTLFYDDDGLPIEQTYRTTTLGWEYFDITSQHDPSRELSGISFFGNVSGQTFLDDVQVLIAVPIPEPGAVTLFLAAIAAILFVRRRRQR